MCRTDFIGYALTRHLETYENEHRLTCTSCYDSVVVETIDPTEAADILYGMGWRGKYNPICPSCGSKDRPAPKLYKVFTPIELKEEMITHIEGKPFVSGQKEFIQKMRNKWKLKVVKQVAINHYYLESPTKKIRRVTRYTLSRLVANNIIRHEDWIKLSLGLK
jgi:hypothetical protein